MGHRTTDQSFCDCSMTCAWAVWAHVRCGVGRGGCRTAEAHLSDHDRRVGDREWEGDTRVRVEVREVVPVAGEGARFSKAEQHTDDVKGLGVGDGCHASSSDAPDGDDDCQPGWSADDAYDQLAGYLEGGVPDEEQA